MRTRVPHLRNEYIVSFRKFLAHFLVDQFLLDVMEHGFDSGSRFLFKFLTKSLLFGATDRAHSLFDSLLRDRKPTIDAMEF